MSTSGKTTGKSLVFTLDNQGGAGDVDISAYVKSVSGLPGEIELAEVTVGGSAGYKYYPALQKVEFSLECVFDDAASSAWTITKDFMSDTTTRGFVFEPAGATSGYLKITGECWIKKVSLPVKTTELMTFTIDCVVDGALTITTV
ncbi:MAG: hypothetical protein M0R74_14350 [Dehalococcoidia bacterium]|nr:hypothetical protein [Dehalococcoidia bacterium]